MAYNKCGMSGQVNEAEAQREAALAVLWAEFDRLNETFFAGNLHLREIRLSTRKQYGGYYQKARSLIVVSWPAHLEFGWEETLNTFRHEVAHIVHQNHALEFWALAARLGCTPRHASSPANRPIHPKCRFVYECPNCKGQVFRQKRLIKASCGKCDRRFNPAFQLKLVATRINEVTKARVDA